ncbi:MAG: bifunctional copper resistance protein CopD/cytochrome c oxidase assembly protein [Actinobacteria bacterium]|nr:bifunctional copper resistance protein CopD/cytochrome c oxidase assembly protein [Actinomycetota bacterium]
MISLAAAAAGGQPLVSAIATMSKFFGIAASIAVVGVLLAGGFLLEDRNGELSPAALALKRVATLAAAVWAAAAALNIWVSVADILGSSMGAALDPTIIRSFITQITLGQYMFFQLLVAIFVLVCTTRLRRVGGTVLLLIATLIGILAPVFQSHSASSGSHPLAIGSLCIHVVAISLWIGGIFALAVMDPGARALAIPRFSQLALWTAIAVVVSGSANALTRLNFLDAWTSSYAYVVIAKIVLTGVLIYFGFQQRRNISRENSAVINLAKFSKIVSIELIIMITAVALGSWLSFNPPPAAPSTGEFDPALSIAGLPMPQAPNLTRLIFSYDPDALFIGLLVLASALYIRGIIILKKRGDEWPKMRTTMFFVGILLIDYATSGGYGVYSHFAFSYHMVAHMILGMIAPIFLILSAPITLALRTLPIGRTRDERGVRGTLIAALHSRLTRFWVNPVVALLIFDGSLFGLYFTSLFGGMMQSHIGHFAMDVHFLLSGLLFFHVIIGVDPNPRKVPHLVRVVILFAAMSIHAFFSVALMSSSGLVDGGYFASLQRPWLTDLLADQRQGGAIGWAMGEIPILLALVATFILWVRDDSRETRRIDRNTERLAAMGRPDELAEYNAYLAALAERDRRGT